jgi:hypothetical protein
MRSHYYSNFLRQEAQSRIPSKNLVVPRGSALKSFRTWQNKIKTESEDLVFWEAANLRVLK